MAQAFRPSALAGLKPCPTNWHDRHLAAWEHCSGCGYQHHRVGYRGQGWGGRHVQGRRGPTLVEPFAVNEDVEVAFFQDPNGVSVELLQLP